MIPNIRGFTGIETFKLSIAPSLDAASLKGLGSMPNLREFAVLAEKKGINKRVCYLLMDWKPSLGEGQS